MNSMSTRDFSELKRLSLREIWKHEANDFTPWLASNIQKLGDAIGLDLVLTDREAAVGDFSLDLLAEEVGTSRTVVIENQFKRTDHDHLGKLLTYAAGFDASIVIWLAEDIRDEHRQVLEWLNQKDVETLFFAIVVEVLQIDDSNYALDFKQIVAPNAWQKSKKREISTRRSPKSEKYRIYFQGIIDELTENHNYTGKRRGQPQNWLNLSLGFAGIRYRAQFMQGGKVLTSIIIYENESKNRMALFDALEKQKAEITNSFGCRLEWEWDRGEEQKISRIAVYREGSIDSDDKELEAIKAWHVENLLKFKEVFTPKIEHAFATLETEPE